MKESRPIAHALALLVLSCFHYGRSCCGWVMSPTTKSWKTPALLWTLRGGDIQDETTITDDACDNVHSRSSRWSSPRPSSAYQYSLEVVGASGRMGSLWLKQEGSVAVPRGVSPGCLSPPNSPIYVATPSSAWKQVREETIPSRRNDLVWVGNGILHNHFVNSTVVVPHYGILSVGAKPISGSSSPPTYVYGKHANRTVEILKTQRASGSGSGDNSIIPTEIVSSWTHIQARAAQKLLWASCMWLLCHLSDPPLTVDQVHDDDHRKHNGDDNNDVRKTTLEPIVEELLPVLETIIDNGTSIKLDLNETLSYLEAYSRSMPGALPSKELAIREVQERNGVWLALRNKHPQPLHQDLLSRVIGTDSLEELLATSEAILDVQSTFQQPNERRRIDLNESGLTVWGSSTAGSSSSGSSAAAAMTTTAVESAIVIGGGIVGSSIALNLARRGVNVTVLDRLGVTELGATTLASWAWINANNKSPDPYRWLNQLGMHSWRTDPVLVDLPSWNGALVQYKESPHFPGGYNIEGPLSARRVHELEPQSNFSYSDGPIYYFSNEGCVDPASAVHLMREAAKVLGATFKSGHNVTTLLRNEHGHVYGLESRQDAAKNPSETTVIEADVVVVAAGIGSASPALGGLPLTHSPGQIAFASVKESSLSSQPCRLRRILVDTVRESHVLQRRDGTLVVGGGFLEVGGTPTASSKRSTPQSSDRTTELLSVATRLSPGTLGNSEFLRTVRAQRPIPCDGYPAIGFLCAGLYVAVSHSGVTLSPIIGALIAAELATLTEVVDLDILQPYRPARLFAEQAENMS